MAYDFELQPGLTMGEWFHMRLSETGRLDTQGWTAEQLGRVSARLQVQRGSNDPLQVQALWVDEPTAFTLPGRYVYFGRSLLDRCFSEECVAFIIAHEMAHHDLGHMRLIADWLVRIGPVARVPGSWLPALGIVTLERRLYGPERECDADHYGMALCVAAGYDAKRCLEAFELMEQVLLEYGDIAGVLGPEAAAEANTAGRIWTPPPNSRLARARLWAWQRTRGYLPVRDRKERVQALLAGRTIRVDSARKMRLAASVSWAVRCH